MRIGVAYVAMNKAFELYFVPQINSPLCARGTQEHVERGEGRTTALNWAQRYK